MFEAMGELLCFFELTGNMLESRGMGELWRADEKADMVIDKNLRLYRNSRCAAG